MPWKLIPPPVPEVLLSNAVTVATTTYWAPVTLLSFAPVDFETRPEAARSCSPRTASRLWRSTILNFSVEASSFDSMLARSLPTSLLHHPALVSFRNSDTASTGFAANAEDTDNSRDAANRMNLRILFSRNWVPRNLRPRARPNCDRPHESNEK